MKRMLFSALVVCSVVSFAAHAQSDEVMVATSRAPAASDHEPPPLSNYIAEYRDKRRVILEGIDRLPPGTPISERLAVYEREMGKLREAFRTSRRAEYAGINAERSVDHSCTKGSSGGVKNCGWKCTARPSSNVEPNPDTIRVEGDNKGTKIEGGSACLKMTRASRGRNYGILYVKYRYNPALLEQHLHADTTRLFNVIGSQG